MVNQALNDETTSDLDCRTIIRNSDERPLSFRRSGCCCCCTYSSPPARSRAYPDSPATKVCVTVVGEPPAPGRNEPQRFQREGILSSA